jgi:quinoprotein glucose dehydrogenase
MAVSFKKFLTTGVALSVVIVGAGLYFGTASTAAERTSASEWSYFGGSRKFDRYSPLAQINKANVSKLKVVWERPAIDGSITSEFPDLVAGPNLRGTPIMVGGVLYASNGVGLVEAFEPATGKTLWVQPLAEKTMKEAAGTSVRGVEYWANGADQRIISVRGEWLYALNAKTGQPVAGFGENGRVSLNRHTADQAAYFFFNGPIVVKDVVVIAGQGGGKAGGGYGDGGNTKESSPEDIRGYDVRTGKLLWTFHVMPQKGDSGLETWGKGSASYVGNMGAWAPLSADEELGYVYLPLTAPTNSWFGGHRPGDNLYANSLVAVDAKTGKKVWHFQMVHHDVWDSDNASPPVLGDITVDGKKIKAVMQANKTGFLYTFDRATGKPVWPIVEKPVPPSAVPGEALSPTQPFPSKPAALDKQGITENDLIDFTPELRAEAKKIWQTWTTGPLFTPPSIRVEDGNRGTLAMPGGWGTANWNTGAFDPETGIYYAVTMGIPGPMTLSLPKPDDKEATIDYIFGGGGRSAAQPGMGQPPPQPYGPGPRGLPLTKPPYGSLTAVDMNKGEKLWTVANGDGPRFHAALKHLNLPPLGTLGRPAALVTKSLLFLGESSDAISGRAGVSGEAKFRAYDKATGAVVWETTLPAGTTGGPVSYESGGKQYIVVPTGNDEAGARWIAYALGE